MSSKKYLKILFSFLGFVLLVAMGYTVYFVKYYPLPVTNRISFDAKIKFTRDNIDVDKVDTIIVGSSIGLNNIQGSILENTSKKCSSVLNFSVYEASAFQIEQLLELHDAFPKLRRIIYSAQFSDFQPAARFHDYNPNFLKRYLRKDLSLVEYMKLVFKSCQNIFFCINRQNEWAEKHAENNKFTSLVFDSSGSVPLHIYGKDIIERRWSLPHGPLQVPGTFAAVSRISKKLKEKKIKLYFVQEPYRYELTIDKYVYIGDVMKTFAKRITDIVTEHDGVFFNLHEELHLSDEYFADRSHLNDKGSRLTAEAIAKFIDNAEK